MICFQCIPVVRRVSCVVVWCGAGGAAGAAANRGVRTTGDDARQSYEKPRLAYQHKGGPNDSPAASPGAAGRYGASRTCIRYFEVQLFGYASVGGPVLLLSLFLRRTCRVSHAVLHMPCFRWGSTPSPMYRLSPGLSFPIPAQTNAASHCRGEGTTGLRYLSIVLITLAGHS